jgi:hypothetical protein
MAAGTIPQLSKWRSREEAMLQTGVWTGLAPHTPEWQPSDFGSTHVFHRLGRYAQDVSGGSSDGRQHADRCNKHQRSNRKLIPGIMLFWCMGCRKCVMFSIMPDAESPRTVADLLRTHLPAPPQRFQMDNACNLHAFILNREPAYYANTQFLIDDCHWRNHVNCPEAYFTGNAWSLYT